MSKDISLTPRFTKLMSFVNYGRSSGKTSRANLGRSDSYTRKQLGLRGLQASEMYLMILRGNTKEFQFSFIQSRSRNASASFSALVAEFLYCARSLARLK
jgi:hypothetical protein